MTRGSCKEHVVRGAGHKQHKCLFVYNSFCFFGSADVWNFILWAPRREFESIPVNFFLGRGSASLQTLGQDGSKHPGAPEECCAAGLHQPVGFVILYRFHEIKREGLFLSPASSGSVCLTWETLATRT